MSQTPANPIMSSVTSSQTALDTSATGTGAATPATVDELKKAEGGSAAEAKGSAYDSLSKARKYSLLLIFMMATTLDIFSVSAFFVTARSIGEALQLDEGNITWIITAYSMTFAAFLLFAGRLSDIIPASIVFETGFVGVGALSLITSFVTNKYGHIILRALTGVAASLTIPSAYRMITELFTDKTEQQMALSMLGLVAAISNSTGVIIGGLFQLGRSDWRWLYRFLAILALSSSAIGFFLLPRGSASSTTPSQRSFVRRLDLPGVFLLTGSLLLFILGLTSGSSITNGWTDSHFIAPFTISIVMFIGFFLWESKVDPADALLPTAYFKLPNMKILVFTALSPYMFWATSQLNFAQFFQVVLAMSPILAGARLLPQGIAGIIGGMLSGIVPVILAKPKWTILSGLILGMVGIILQIFSFGGRGLDYWKFLFPGFLIGSFGCILTFLALNVSIIQAMPTQAAGVAGGLLQTTLQIGAVIGLSTMSGIYSTVDNDISNWKGSQNGFFFVLAWFGITTIAFAIFYHPEKTTAAEKQKIEMEIERAQGRI